MHISKGLHVSAMQHLPHSQGALYTHCLVCLLGSVFISFAWSVCLVLKAVLTLSQFVILICNIRTNFHSHLYHCLPLKPWPLICSSSCFLHKFFKQLVVIVIIKFRFNNSTKLLNDQTKDKFLLSCSHETIIRLS
jgi:hypothetical protein